MKRTITLVLFALFVIGKSCFAQQTLTAGQALQAEVNMEQVNKSRRAEEATAQKYWVDALSNYDANGHFTPTGYKENYTVDITVEGNEVTIDNLVPLSEYIETISVQSVKGIYDADAHTITVKTSLTCKATTACANWKNWCSMSTTTSRSSLPAVAMATTSTTSFREQPQDSAFSPTIRVA